jgi:hypothetical protein
MPDLEGLRSGQGEPPPPIVSFYKYKRYNARTKALLGGE